MARKPGDANISIQEKAAAVAILNTEARGSLRHAARISGINHETIRQAAKDPEIVNLAGVTKEDLAKGFRDLTAKLLNHYGGLVHEANMTNRGTSLLGIVADKALLYANQPNQITANLDVNAYMQELASRGFAEDEAKAIVEQAQKQITGE